MDAPGGRLAFERPEYHAENVRLPGRYRLNAAGDDLVGARTLPRVMAALARAK
jgi:hypothetical protein